MRRLPTVLAVSTALIVPAAAVAHELATGLDHHAPAFTPPPPPSTAFNAGGPQAEWEPVTTIATGNPHTDIDFFTQNGDTYMSAGTLAIGPNAGGQTIVQLRDGGEVAPSFVSSQPSASCVSDPSAATGLQHDVEATPKGGAPLNIKNPFADSTDAQLLIDATDAPGRCHDQGTMGLQAAPQGGLEIIDITNVATPVEIGLTSHIGEAHTVNIDPKRPHIAYAVTSDTVTVDENRNRANEDRQSSERYDLDGFEVVDLSSCMNFAPATPLAEKRRQCRPKVYRYRFPTTEMALGHTLQTGSQGVFGCHELEVYPSDLLTCAGGNALIALDMSRAFNDNGTPTDYSDDHPRGDPLPCNRRRSTSTEEFMTGARVVDCVNGTGPGTDDLTVAKWLDRGAPSLQGVRWIGSVHHQGRGAGGAATPAYDSTQDIDFDHEAELTASGRFLLATDERGGGILPPGATCAPGGDVNAGNGGVHAYRFDRLTTEFPDSAEEAFEAYARTPQGGKAIFRVPVRTQPEATFCTAHVFQQIPGQNRIFMGWYSQGTHVIDFRERPNGTIEFSEAGFYIPEHANTWVSHVFDWQRNGDGTYTYWGATGDFNLGSAGRSAMDIYKVTLPAPPKPARPLLRDCANGGWSHLQDLNGMPFASFGDCAEYAGD